jgi:hypothetical protein
VNHSFAPFSQQSAGRSNQSQSSISGKHRIPVSPCGLDLSSSISYGEKRLRNTTRQGNILCLKQSLGLIAFRLSAERIFGGLNLKETDEALKISARTAHREWNLAQEWLYRYLSFKLRAADSRNLVTAIKNCWTLFHHQLDFAIAFRQFTHLARQPPEDSRLGIGRDVQLRH